MKKCSRCGIEKPLEAFARKAASKDGRRSTCRDCDAACRAALRAAKRERGECEDCPNLAAPGQTRCAECLEKRRQYDNRRYPARYAAKRGRRECLRCPKPAAPGKTRCPEHLEKQRQRDNKRRAERRSLGQCEYCPVDNIRPAVNGPYCEECCARYREYQNRWLRENGYPHNHRRRARKRGGISEPYSKKDLLIRDGYSCYLCGTRVTEDTCHIDHLLPFHVAERVGGAYDVPLNVRISCVRCNLSLKGNRWLTWHSLAAAEQLGKVYGNARLTGWVQRMGALLKRVERGKHPRELLPSSHL